MDALTPDTLLARVPMYWRRKLIIGLLLAPFFTICYYLPQWVPIFTHRQIPLLGIDRFVPFHPWWIWPYMSMYLLLPLPPIFSIRAAHLRRYSVGMAILFFASCIFFFLMPIAYPRPEMPVDADWLYTRIATIDQPINSLPSLHAGLTAYAIFYARRAWADFKPRTLLICLIVGWVWAALIFYGTLATKQHYLVDLPAGMLVAWLAHRIAWRGSGDKDVVSEVSATREGQLTARE